MIERDLCVRSCYEIPGQMYPRELCWLYDHFAASKSHAEIGVYCGRSLFASCGGMSDAYVYAVDLASPICLAPIPGPAWLSLVRDATLHHIRATLPTCEIALSSNGSLAAARRLQSVGVKLDSVFIDASHEYEDVSADIQAWRQLVKPRGLIAGHDFWPPDQGVMRAVHDAFPDGFEVVPNTRIWFTRQP